MWIKPYNKQSRTQFNCFSPPVMLATFIIEIVLAAYAIWRYKLDIVSRLATAMLVSLAVFQLSEYFVCGGVGMTAEHWSRLGYACITMLPPLGLHLMHVLAGKRQRGMVYAAYATAVGFIAFFLLYADAFTGYQCTGNYVIFQLAVGSGSTYGLYYYGWLSAALILGYRWSKPVQVLRQQRQAIRALAVGYLVFLIPTAIANTVKPETRLGIPSIMCGFAVIFALILALYILPRAGHKTK